MTVVAVLSVFTFTALPAGARAPSLPKRGNFVASARVASIAVYEKPDIATEPVSTYTNPTPTSGELVFLVQRVRSDGWAQVLLPVRPNGSKGWISVNDVTIKFVPFRIVIDLSDHTLRLFQREKEVMNEPVGIGKDSTPTPGGRYYITQLFEPSNPSGAYGPFAYSLSGFSETLDSFNGGEPVVGIHGTNRPGLVGQDVSSGCVRMRNEAIVQLRNVLPLGTPVTIQE
jgi:lipoprotein-anchoring transpeptidase ErfK/SrfK